MLRLVFVFLLLLPLPLAAQSDQGSLLPGLLRYDELAKVLRAEGINENATLLEDFGGVPDDPLWKQRLDQIYDVDTIQALLEAAFMRSFKPRSEQAVVAHLDSAHWRQLFDLQIAASFAMLDPGVESASIEAYWQHLDRGSDRVALIESLVEGSNLVEENVAGAMNAMLAFNQGIADVAPDQAISEGELFAFLDEEEFTIRSEAAEWLMAYYLLAYQPVSDAAVQREIAFWQSQPGRDLTRAMMAAYDVVFDQISYQLGRALAESWDERAL